MGGPPETIKQSNLENGPRDEKDPRAGQETIKKGFRTIQNGFRTIKVTKNNTKTSQTIKNHIEKLKRRNFVPDMIIVDYGDLIRPENSRKDEKRHQLETIYEELRGIAQICECPLWTASQTNRSGLNAEVITMESISEAFNKCFVADFIFTVSRTVEDKNTNQGRIFVAKNRNGPDGLVYPIFMDTSNVCIKVLPQTGETASDIVQNAARDEMKSLKEKYAAFKKQRKGGIN